MWLSAKDVNVLIGMTLLWLLIDNVIASTTFTHEIVHPWNPEIKCIIKFLNL